nr:hypothetical protein CFP56_74663 [Quercus suber]
MSHREYRIIEPDPQYDGQEYYRGRREKYGENWDRQPPSASNDRDYRRYKEHHEEAERHRAAYFDLKTNFRHNSNPQFVSDVAGFPEDRRDLRGLEPRFHARLVDPSLMAESSTRSGTSGGDRAFGDTLELRPSDHRLSEYDASNQYYSDEERQPRSRSRHSGGAEVVEDCCFRTVKIALVCYFGVIGCGTLIAVF